MWGVVYLVVWCSVVSSRVIFVRLLVARDRRPTSERFHVGQLCTYSNRPWRVFPRKYALPLIRHHVPHNGYKQRGCGK